MGVLAGRRLVSCEARGKHLLLRFDGEWLLHSHLGMSGAWHVYRAGERWRRPPASAWLVLSTAELEVIQFGGPTLTLTKARDARVERRIRALGPDLLGDDFRVETGVAMLRRIGQERQLGESLLDQAVLAGIGNVYKSEACFSAGVSPWRRLGDLSDDELRRVVRAAHEQLRRGFETGRLPRQLYRRAGRPCPRCGSRVRSRGQGDANRITYWCPGCQS